MPDQIVPVTEHVTYAGTALDSFFTAMHKGAALVYHNLAAVESDVMQWTHDNPAVQPFLQTAADYGTKFLTGFGIPVPMAELAISAVLASLRDMAVLDSTVSTAVAIKPL